MIFCGSFTAISSISMPPEALAMHWIDFAALFTVRLT